MLSNLPNFKYSNHSNTPAKMGNTILFLKGMAMVVKACDLDRIQITLNCINYFGYKRGKNEKVESSI